ncbi:MAG: hypothetical protein H6806_06740 [Planctomycetes bacterium]|nr:hypothetical protein [Planctomycetota bacterium]MCB9829439.1 hypothetical protein [Planctomycetota bacterium]MCB9900183.1 hypothetical protein [Planctomycetota bacterium]
MTTPTRRGASWRPSVFTGITLGAGACIALLLDALGAGLPFDVLARLHLPEGVGAVLVGGLVSLSALTQGARDPKWRVLPWVAWLAFLALAAPRVLDHPGMAFALVVLAAVFLGAPGLLRELASAGSRRPGGAADLVLGLAMASVVAWVLAVPGRLAKGPLLEAVVLAVLTAAGLAGAALAARGRRVSGIAVALVLVAIVVLGWSHGGTFEGRGGGLLLAALGAGGVAMVLRALRPRAPGVRTRLEGPSVEAARWMITTFLVGGLVGGCVLSLPACTADGRPLPLLEATFTSFSAICVTGLGVVDTITTFGPVGQAVILLLIQIGGLGTMTFSAAALVFLGRRISLRHEATLTTLLSPDERGSLGVALRRVLRMTLVFELVGAALLVPRFLAFGDDLGTALWRGVFTSVSAFCNAGFSLQTDSLMGYQQDVGVLLVVSLLIVIGGLGPLVIAAVPRWLRGKPVRLHARIVIVTTAILLFAPTVFLAIVEWSGSLGHLGYGERLLNAWFQSVTLRTAGFNSIDISAMHPGSHTVMVVLMFIGGSPGSTAGGIKTTTMAVLVAEAWASVRGRSAAVLFHHELPPGTIRRALALVLLGLGAVLGATVLLQLTQVGSFESLLFESVSASATVGLSLGVTPSLDGIGQIVVIACMFAGRVGPLSLFLFLVGQDHRRAVRRPVQDIPVG